MGGMDRVRLVGRGSREALRAERVRRYYGRWAATYGSAGDDLAASGTGRGAFEGAKSAIVFAGSFALNTILPSVATYGLHLVPVSAIMGAPVVVGLGWNFPLNRWWVFDAALHKERSTC